MFIQVYPLLKNKLLPQLFQPSATLHSVLSIQNDNNSDKLYLYMNNVLHVIAIYSSQLLEKRYRNCSVVSYIVQP